MSKELIWSDEMEYVYGWYRDFESIQEFIETVKSRYEDGECNVEDAKRELCFVTERGLKPDLIVPVNLTDVTLEEFYTARVEPIEETSNSFDISDIDGCEFVKSRVVGNMMISFHKDFDSCCYTGKILVVYADGSRKAISQEEAQAYIDSGEW
ncbi:hypothetical protein, partial [Mycobacteroides abscessus]|uniref:hypothetical protein n=1 Tax=Mycobacteroides abscessus TaxID=36809 RepID=UPI00130010F7